MGSTIKRDDGAVHVRSSLTNEEHEHTHNVFTGSESLTGVGLDEEVAGSLNHAGSHLGGDESGSNHVDGDVTGAQLNGQSLSEVVDSGLGGQVAVNAALCGVADANSGHRAHDDDSRGIGVRSALFEQRGEQLDGGEDALDVELQHLGDGGLGVVLDGSSPCGASVGNENVALDIVAHNGSLGLLKALEQLLDTGMLADVCGERNGLAGKSLRVESLTGLVTGLALSRRNVHSGSSTMEKTVGAVEAETSGAAGDNGNLVLGRVAVLGEFWESFDGHFCVCCVVEEGFGWECGDIYVCGPKR